LRLIINETTINARQNAKLDCLTCTKEGKLKASEKEDQAEAAAGAN
jgi:hypothetical protein